MAVFFWHEYEENGFLSNWYASPFVIQNFCYLHAEQYIMARKAEIFRDSKNYTAILRATTPGDCKNLGKKVTPYDDAVWSYFRKEVLNTALHAKFTQNSDLRDALLATGDQLLAEASPKDLIFGIGLQADAASVIPQEKWPGENLLGKALMELRSQLRSSKA